MQNMAQSLGTYMDNIIVYSVIDFVEPSNKKHDRSFACIWFINNQFLLFLNKFSFAKKRKMEKMNCLFHFNECIVPISFHACVCVDRTEKNVFMKYLFGNDLFKDISICALEIFYVRETFDNRQADRLLFRKEFFCCCCCYIFQTFFFCSFIDINAAGKYASHK